MVLCSLPSLHGLVCAVFVVINAVILDSGPKSLA